MKLWHKGYSLSKKVEEFTVGDDILLDKKLLPYDCKASIAHAQMLGKIGILNKQEVQKLTKALNEIIILDRQDKFVILSEQEDCHTAIEEYLTTQLGSLGKKIHAARSRNDQVLVALRLYYKDQLIQLRSLILKFKEALKKLIKKYGQIPLPGYTHMRKAMPSSVGLWAQCFYDSMKDNIKLLDKTMEIIDQSPLGSAAGYGVPIKIDREFTSKKLGFKKVQNNPLYVQLSRGKFEATILHLLTQVMIDLNKMASDIIFFSISDFGYFDLPKEYCTGSSIMPQKKNPDVLELIRAKYHVVVANELQIKNVSANLISGYNRDINASSVA
jgi:argininosuccinate lyase